VDLVESAAARLIRDHTVPIRGEPQWPGEKLSAARDAEVALAHLCALTAEPATAVAATRSRR
jgi:hypothetical protein